MLGDHNINNTFADLLFMRVMKLNWVTAVQILLLRLRYNTQYCHQMELWWKWNVTLNISINGSSIWLKDRVVNKTELSCSMQKWNDNNKVCLDKNVERKLVWLHRSDFVDWGDKGNDNK